MRRRGFRAIAVLLSLLILANKPVQAGPVVIRDVVQRIRSYQNPPELRLRNFSQLPQSRIDSLYDTLQPTNVSADATVVDVDSPVGSNTGTRSLLAGIATDIDDQKPVTVVAQGDIEATICDCGEVTVPGGFPKWPLLFLAAIPLFFIHDDDCVDCDRITPTPTPPPVPTPTPTVPQTPVPEPASLLLFGSGLAAVGAALRRRRNKGKTIPGDMTEEG